jgi:hypothetical protein
MSRPARRSGYTFRPFCLVFLVVLMAGCLSMKHSNPLDPKTGTDQWGRSRPVPEPGLALPLLIDDCEDGDWQNASGNGNWRTEVPFFSSSTITPNSGTPVNDYMLGAGYASAKSFRAYGQIVCEYFPPAYYGYAVAGVQTNDYLLGYQRVCFTSKGSGAPQPIEVTLTLKFNDGDQFSTSYQLPGSWTSFSLPFGLFLPVMPVGHQDLSQEGSRLVEMIFAISTLGALDENVTYDFYLDDIWLK